MPARLEQSETQTPGEPIPQAQLESQLTCLRTLVVPGAVPVRAALCETIQAKKRPDFFAERKGNKLPLVWGRPSSHPEDPIMGSPSSGPPIHCSHNSVEPICNVPTKRCVEQHNLYTV